MSRLSRMKQVPAERISSHEDVKEDFLRAIPGEHRRVTDDLVHGFRVWSDRKQIASAYFGDNSKGNEVEFALNFRLLEEDRQMHASVQCWLDHQKGRLGTRRVHIHQRGILVDWFRIGFEFIEQALEFLKQLRAERLRPNHAERWQIVDEHSSWDRAESPNKEPNEERQEGGEPEVVGALRTDWTPAVVRMVTTAEQTIVQSKTRPWPFFDPPIQIKRSRRQTFMRDQCKGHCLWRRLALRS